MSLRADQRDYKKRLQEALSCIFQLAGHRQQPEPTAHFGILRGMRTEI